MASMTEPGTCDAFTTDESEPFTYVGEEVTASGWLIRTTFLGRPSWGPGNAYHTDIFHPRIGLLMSKTWRGA